MGRRKEDFLVWGKKYDEPYDSDDLPDYLPGYLLCPDCHMPMSWDERKEQFKCECGRTIDLNELSYLDIDWPQIKPDCCYGCPNDIWPDCWDGCKIAENNPD